MREGGRLKKRERDREKGEVLEKQMCQNCMPTMNVNTLWIVVETYTNRDCSLDQKDDGMTPT